MLMTFIPNVSAQKFIAPRSHAQSLTYDVVFHWGMIWKSAATVSYSYHPSGETATLKMVATTKSWAETFHRTRDTITCKVRTAGIRPIQYREKVHEGKNPKISWTNIDYKWSGVNVSAHSTSMNAKGESTDNTFTASGNTYDVLSMLYMVQQLDFSGLSKDTPYTATLIGRSKQTLTLQYVGDEEIKMRNKNKYQAHHVTLKFQNVTNKKANNAPIDVWISTDGQNIPLMVRAKISVGEIRCYCNGK